LEGLRTGGELKKMMMTIINLCIEEGEEKENDREAEKEECGKDEYEEEG
jgi:hypothetical protein